GMLSFYMPASFYESVRNAPGLFCQGCSRSVPTQCGSPALKDHRFCFFHQQWHERKLLINSARARRARASISLPVLEDANAIQLSVMQIMQLLLSGQIEQKTAGLLFYGLQIASSHLQ